MLPPVLREGGFASPFARITRAQRPEICLNRAKWAEWSSPKRAVRKSGGRLPRCRPSLRMPTCRQPGATTPQAESACRLHGSSSGLAMFCVTEAEAATIRTAYLEDGELSTAIALRRLFPGLADNAKARLFARQIAGWQRPGPPLGTAVVVRLRPSRASLIMAERSSTVPSPKRSAAP